MTVQEKLLDVPVQTPLPKAWDAIEQKPVDSEHQRALEGLPHYWKQPWPSTDMIILECGHRTRVWVERLVDPAFEPDCPYKEFGACK